MPNRNLMFRKKLEKESAYRVIDFNTDLNFKSNKVVTQTYTFWNIIPKTFLEEFQKLSYFWLIFLMAVEFSPYCNKISLKISVALPLGIMLLSRLNQNIKIAWIQYKHDKEINSRWYQTFDDSDFCLKQSQDLKVGDLILAKSNDIIPVDGIILAVDSDINEVYTSIKGVQGVTNLIKKKPIKETQNFVVYDGMNIVELIKKIEHVKVNTPCKSFTKLRGKIKIKGDPHVTRLTLENFILTGTQIIDCNWVLILSVYTGKDAKIWHNLFNKNKPRQSKFDKNMNFGMIVNFIIMISAILLCFFIGFYYYNDNIKDTGEELFLNYVILFGFVMSLSFYMVIRLIKYTQTHIILRNEFKSDNNCLSINNFKVLESLGQVEYILTEKSGILTEPELTIQTCIIQNTIYMGKEFSEPSERTPLNRNESDENYADSESMTKHNINSVETLKLEMQDENLDTKKLYFSIGMIMCNQFLPNSDKAIGEDDNAIREFCQEIGIKVLARDKRNCDIEIGKKIIKLHTLCAEYVEKNVMKIAIKNLTDNEVVILSKGPLESSIKYFKEENELEMIDECLASRILYGIRKIAYGFRIIQPDELKEFLYELKQAQTTTINYKGRLKVIFDKYGALLSYLGLIGVEHNLHPGVCEAVSNLTEAGVKIWITTCDTEESALLTGIRTGIISEDVPIIRLSNYTNPREVLEEMEKAVKQEVFMGRSLEKRFSIEEAKSDNYEHLISEIDAGSEYHPASDRNSTKTIRNNARRLSKKKSSIHPMLLSLGLSKKTKNFRRLRTKSINFALYVNAKSLDLALTSRIHRKNLCVLLFTAKSVFFSNLTPEHKRKIIKLLRNNFAFKPTIMAVTSENSDAGVCLEADIGVYVNNYSESKILSAKSDFSNDEDTEKHSNQLMLNVFHHISVKSFSKLSEIILKNGYYSHIRLTKVIKLCLYKNFLLFSGLFWYQIISRFSATPFIDYDIIVCYDLFVSFVYIAIIGIFDKDFRKNELEDFPNKYSLGFLRPALNFRDFSITVGQSIIHGTLIFVFLTLFQSNIVSAQGHTEDYESFGLYYFIIITLMVFFKGFSFSNRFLHKISYIILGILCLILILAIACNYKLGYSFISSYSIIHRGAVWFIVCLAPLFSLISSYINTDYIFKDYFKSRIEQYSNKIQRVFTDSTDWKINPNDNSLEINKRRLNFKSLFKEREYLEDFFIKNLVFTRFVLFFIVIIALINLILVLSSVPAALEFSYYTVFPTVLLIIYPAISYIKNLNWIKYHYFMFAIIVIIIVIDAALDTSRSTILRYPILMVIFCISFSFNWFVSLIRTILLYIISIIFCSLEAQEKNSQNIYGIIFHWIIIMLAYSILILIITSYRGLSTRADFAFLQKVEIEVEKAANILGYLLPEFVKKRVKEGVRYIAEDKGTVSVVFCDMCDFDKIVNLYTPQELTYFLDDVFGRIDLLCENLGVSKIETVGKTYLACAGLKDSESVMDPMLIKVPHARRAVELGLAIMKEMEKIELKDGSTLMFKIGINSGPVTAGVVGYHKPQFSLVGDTVNTSSRMSSTLTDPNSIQISMATYNLLGDKIGLKFKDRTTEVKGKGIMETKIVEVSRQATEEFVDENSSLPRRPSANIGRNSSFSLSSPTRLSECTHTQNNPKDKRSSLLINLEVNNDSDLLKKANTQRLFKIVNFICKETQAEKNFRLEFLESNYEIRLYGLYVAITCNGLLIILESIQIALLLEYHSIVRLVTLIVEVIFMIILLLLYKKHNSKLKYCYTLSFVYTLNFPIFFIASFVDHSSIFIEIMYFMYRFLLMNFFSGLLFARTLYMNILNISIWIIEISLWNPYFSTFIYSISQIILILVTVYTYENRQRINTVLKSVANKELQKTEELLMHMMPPQALRNLQEENMITYRLSQVTLMYADIVGFTAWSSVRTSREVVGMLSELFTRFDKMCVEYNIYKVHTIGDCYVAMGYMDEHQRIPAKEAVNMLRFARSLIKVIEETNEKCNCELNMRIGMHTGEIIGGITGTQIVRYDIYGSDVLIANKMESNGEPGNVTVSEKTKNLIENYMPDSYKFNFLKEINIPVLGKSIKIYLVTFLSEVLEINRLDQ
ncbi:hypothetical protein SteCoe_9233 [Stentor coeruleus]|uniref:Guanylate cyclase domain-containing protein n=1 Tax=Stentor coeruleus TaxID=5963 RepID=A0A1R2CID7_9CILI|nr:hypothetical protein SteCoe_9233 [Stentor coeruleus]